MKLELKHIAPYLPYDIQGIDKFNNYYYLYSIDSRMGNVDLWMNGNFHKFNGGDGIKPIVRPLSDLNKDEFKDLAKAIFETNLLYRDWDDTKYLVETLRVGYLPKYIVEKLYENHFDVFRLIESGLAIDINTIKE